MSEKTTSENNPPTERLTLTLTTAAKEMGVSSDTVMRWVEAGHLPIFVPPGVDLKNTRPGPRGYLIFKTDWEAFKRRQTFVGGLPIVPPPTPATGTSSVSSVRQRRRRP